MGIAKPMKRKIECKDVKEGACKNTPFLSISISEFYDQAFIINHIHILNLIISFLENNLFFS